MSLGPGTKLGPYEILSPAGAGGMGEVYKARDARLERTVAIKVLPSHLSSDATARQRFEREARTISALSHQNICHLYDVGREGAVDFLVMEYLEGETLADRLAKGPLPQPQVMKVGQEICAGLEKAHRSGVVHRDLKPANIMLTKSGAKLMDFGLAKPMALPANMATMSSLDAPQQPLTSEGSIVGTFNYMSPEQVEGKELDARSDIFSLGAVLYEMVTGKKAFVGKSQLSIASAILEKSPEPISTIQPMVPASLEHLVQTCLAKDPDERWQAASDLGRELQWLSQADGSQVRPLQRRPIRLRWRGWAAAALLVLGALAAGYWLRPPEAVPVLRASVPAPEKLRFLFEGDLGGPPVLSPDGGGLVFKAMSESGEMQLYVRDNATGAVNKLEGTERAFFPFWSPDSKKVGFFTDTSVLQVSRQGGTPTLIAPATGGRGGAWLPDGSVVFTPTTRSPILRVRHAGETPEPVTTIPAWETTHRWPEPLPDGKHFLYFSTNHAGPTDAHPAGIHFASVDGKLDKFLVASNAQAQYSAGHLLYLRAGKLVAQRMDPSSGELIGDTVEIADDVRNDPLVWRAVFTVNEQGLLFFQRGAGRGGNTLAWFDRTGKMLQNIYIPTGVTFLGWNAAGGQLVTESNPNNRILVHDINRGTSRRLTTEALGERHPIWSSDGRSVFYTADTVRFGEGTRGSGIRRRAADGTGPVEKILDLPNFMVVTSVAPGDRVLAAGSVSGDHTSIIFVDVAQKKIVRKLEGPANFSSGIFSPDGKWLAYLSDVSGKQELYVVSATAESAPVQVSVGGAKAILWTRQGRELCSPSEQGMSCADVKASPAGFSAGPPKLLFPLPKQLDLGNPSLAVSPDGSRFLMGIVDPGTSSPLEVITRWQGRVKP